MWMLALSALLMLAASLTGAITIGTVLLAWHSGGVSRPVVVGAIRRLPSFVLPVPFVLGACGWCCGATPGWPRTAA